MTDGTVMKDSEIFVMYLCCCFTFIVSMCYSLCDMSLSWIFFQSWTFLNV